MLSTAAVGIDISEASVRVVCLKKGLRAARFAAAEKCLLAEDKPLKEKAEDVSGFINEFLREHRISAADIYMGIPSGRVMFREIELPMAARENLSSTIAYEMEKYVPLSAEEVFYDFQVVTEDKDREMLSVCLAVIKRTDLEAFLNLAAAFDLAVSGISPGCAGVAASFLQDEKGNGGCRMVAFADEKRLELAVIRRKTLIYAKSLHPGSGESSDEVCSRQIQTLLTRFGVPGAQTPLFLHAAEPEGDISGRLRQAAPEAFQGHKPPVPDLPADEYIPAYGLALQAFAEAGSQFNLMPFRLRKKPNKTPLYVMYGLGCCLVLAGLLWGGVFLVKQHTYVERLDQELSRLRAEAREIEQIRSDIDRLQSRIHRLESLRPGNAYVVNVLMELTRRIPDSAWVRVLNISGNEVTVHGTAESASALVPVLDDAPMFHGVEFLSSIRKTRQNKELYRIGFKFYTENK
ncbi:MAG: pilus assembly protein PilM [Desulfosalsimonadaceae bacterium]